MIYMTIWKILSILKVLLQIAGSSKQNETHVASFISNKLPSLKTGQSSFIAKLKILRQIEPIDHTISQHFVKLKHFDSCVIFKGHKSHLDVGGGVGQHYTPNCQVGDSK